MTTLTAELIPITRMSRDIRAAATTLYDHEARFLVDAYYQMQEDRIRSSHRALRMQQPLTETERVEPNEVIAWLATQSGTLETQIKGALDRYTLSKPIGAWLRSIKGIGPVIAAGYMANVDIRRSNTAGKLWKYCGVAPGFDRRKRGEKVCFNPALKRLTWLAGESFKRLGSDDPDAFYRHIYDKRKAYETTKNEAGDYREQAEQALATKTYDKATEAFKAYSVGKLPLGRIDRRAARYAAKMFLSHLQEVWYEMETGEHPPKPFALSHLHHADYIAPPRADLQV